MNRMSPFEADVSIQQEMELEIFLQCENRVVRVHRTGCLPQVVLQPHPKVNNRLTQSQNWHIASNLLHHLVFFHQPFSHLPPVGQPIRPHPCVSTSLQEHTASILLRFVQFSSSDEVIQVQRLLEQGLRSKRGKSSQPRRCQSC